MTFVSRNIFVATKVTEKTPATKVTEKTPANTRKLSAQLKHFKTGNQVF